MPQQKRTALALAQDVAGKEGLQGGASEVAVTSQHSYSWTGGQLLLGGVHVPVICFEGVDDVFFKAKPIHNYFGCQNITHTLARVDDCEKGSLKELYRRYGELAEGIAGHPTPNHEDYHEGKAIYVNESGLYKILLGSRKPDVKPFRDWVCREVLPSIRKTGAYSLTKAPVSCEIAAANLIRRIPVRRALADSTITSDAALTLSAVLRDVLSERGRGRPIAPKDFRLLRLRFVKHFLALAGRENPLVPLGELVRRYRVGGHGDKATVPKSEEVLVRAAAVSVLEGADVPPVGATPAGPSSLARETATKRRAASGTFLKWERERKRRLRPRRGYGPLADSDQQQHKDLVNREFCALLQEEAADGSAADGNVVVLDYFRCSELRETDGGVPVSSDSMRLRTTEALLAAGVPPASIRVANPDPALALCCQKVTGVLETAWQGPLEEAPCSFFGEGLTPLRGAFVDGCSGSAATLHRNLQLCAARLQPGGVLGWTLVGRDFDGDFLTTRVLRILDFLQGPSEVFGRWVPARGSLEASTCMYKSSFKGQQVITQFWRKGGQN
jgi:prophage antirepressor-like protein